MKKVLVLFIIFLSTAMQSQTVDVLVKGDTLQKPNYQQFIYLCDSTDVSNALFVGKIRAAGSLKYITRLYYFIKNKAQEKGANGFKFESFEKIDSDNGALVLSTFLCSDTLFNANFAHIPKNKIFIYGDEDMTEHKAQSYKVNGEKHEIDSGQFKVFDIKPNEEYKINKGGFTGMTYWVKRTEEGYSKFYSFSGLGLNGADYALGGGVGVSFNTGKIDRVDPNLGLTLLKIYSQRK